MTLDVTIGKIVIENCKNKPRADVEQCPNADHNVCDSEFTRWVCESYRSGSGDFWDFWTEQCKSVYCEFRDNPCTCDREVAYIRPHIDAINALPDVCDTDANTDRMKWFKYWANVAVELCGNDAGIKFC